MGAMVGMLVGAIVVGDAVVGCNVGIAVGAELVGDAEGA